MTSSLIAKIPKIHVTPRTGISVHTLFKAFLAFSLNSAFFILVVKNITRSKEIIIPRLSKKIKRTGAIKAYIAPEFTDSQQNVSE